MRIDPLIIAMFMSIDGPEQSKFRNRISSAERFRASWGPDAVRLAQTYQGRETIFRTLNRILDGGNGDTGFDASDLTHT